jgi:hypothetical protein
MSGRSKSLGEGDRDEDIVVRIKADAGAAPRDEPVPANPLFWISFTVPIASICKARRAVSSAASTTPAS